MGWVSLRDRNLLDPGLGPDVPSRISALRSRNVYLSRTIGNLRLVTDALAGRPPVGSRFARSACRRGGTPVQAVATSYDKPGRKRSHTRWLPPTDPAGWVVLDPRGFVGRLGDWVLFVAAVL